MSVVTTESPGKCEEERKLAGAAKMAEEHAALVFARSTSFVAGHRGSIWNRF